MTDKQWLTSYQIPGGPVVRFRDVRPDDDKLIAKAVDTASRTTLLHRFFSPVSSVPVGQLRQMLTLDPARERCVVGVITGDDKTQHIICGARLVKIRNSETGEIALTVHDDFQRRGLGKFMMKLLLQMAAQEKISTIEAYVMATNIAMLQLLKSVAPNHRREYQGDVCRAIIHVPPLPS